MRILVLDDDLNRLKQFGKNLIGHLVDMVTTAPETINLLKEKNYDILFLDHDLGGKAFVPSGPGTGYEVACWLSENPSRKPEKIYIHSFNPSGAKNMKLALPEAIIAPGVWTQLKP